MRKNHYYSKTRKETGNRWGKYIVLDILARDGQGHFYNIEMQVRRRPDWSARSVYYMAKALGDQLKSGGAYSALQPVIGIHLLDFELFTDDQQASQALWCFELRDRTQPTVCVGREIQLNIIELPKADRLGVASGDLAAWVAYFKHWQEEATMNQIIHPPVQQALAHLKALSGDEDALLERLLVKRFGVLPEDLRQRLAQARPEQLEVWSERLLDAPTMLQLLQDRTTSTRKKFLSIQQIIVADRV